MRRILICLLSCLSLLCGCSRQLIRLSETENKLEQSMMNYFSETELPLFTGEYIEIKVKDLIIYYDEGHPIYVYDLLIAPIYDQKTVITGISLDSTEFPGKYEKLYYEINFTYEKLKRKLHTYKKTEEILCNEFQFMLVDNSWWYNYSITEEELESCLHNISVTVTINGNKDKVDLTGLIFHDYSEIDNYNRCIQTLIKTGNHSASLRAYVESNYTP